MARTEVRIGEELARRLEALADEEGRTLEETTARVLERGLEACGRSSDYRLQLEEWETEIRPGVDLSNRSSLPWSSQWPPRA